MQAMVNERVEAKRYGKHDVSDSIRKTLRDKYGIGIDDHTKEWRFILESYDLSPLQTVCDLPISEKDYAYIQEKVSERAVAKLNKNYPVADEIRALLKAKFCVLIDDQTREWKVDLPSKEGGFVSKTAKGKQQTSSSTLNDLDEEFDAIFGFSEVRNDAACGKTAKGKLATSLSTLNDLDEEFDAIFGFSEVRDDAACGPMSSKRQKGFKKVG